jgi:signal transduction histidine kinase
MDELIEGLLRYARAGGSELEFRDVSLRDVVRQAWDGLAARVRREGAQLETGSLPTLAGDSTLLRVLFANLFENALKYRGDDAPRVRVEGTSEGGTATLTVADNGSGLTGEALERAFEPFVRGAVAGSPGSGVGLATCRRIVERHGGAIDLTTRPGHGTTFRIELPVAHRDGAGGSRSRRR